MNILGLISQLIGIKSLRLTEVITRVLSSLEFNMCGRFAAQESEDWNRETIMRHTWNVFAQAGSIWLAWIKSNLRRVRSFWIIKISQN